MYLDTTFLVWWFSLCEGIGIKCLQTKSIMAIQACDLHMYIATSNLNWCAYSSGHAESSSDNLNHIMHSYSIVVQPSQQHAHSLLDGMPWHNVCLKLRSCIIIIIMRLSMNDGCSYLTPTEVICLCGWGHIQSNYF